MIKSRKVLAICSTFGHSTQIGPLATPPLRLLRLAMSVFQRFQYFVAHSLKWLGLIILLRFLSMQLIAGIHIPILDDLVFYVFEFMRLIAKQSIEFAGRHFTL